LRSARDNKVVSARCPGPVRDTRTPQFRPPAGSVDCHAHLFGPARAFPFAENRSFTPEDCSLADYLALLETLGIDRAVLVQGGAHGTDNAVTLDGIARSGGRFRGVAVVAPDVTDEELARLDRGGIRGIRLSALLKSGTGFAPLETLGARVKPMGWHLELHLARSEQMLDLAPRVEALGVPVVIDHFARVTGEEGLAAPGFQRMLDLLRDGADVWVKFSSFYRVSSAGFPYDDMRPMAEATIQARPERVVWGTNWPHPIFEGPMPNDGDLVDLFARWVPDPKLQRRILVDNPETLYGFPPWQGN
jgi:predicted TIM-barrel fold metal-dependent hydrolase